MRPVQVDIEVRATDVGVPQSKGLVGLEPERRLRVLSDPVEGGAAGREGGGELEVLVLEDEEGRGVGGGGVEEDVAGGAAGDGEGEGGGVAEVEDEVGGGGGEAAVGARGGRRWRRRRSRGLAGRGRRSTRDEVVGDFPSAAVGVCDPDPKTTARFEAGRRTVMTSAKITH